MSMPRRRRAVLLVEFLAVMLPAAILLGLLGLMISDFLTLQRLAAEHATRMSLVDSLCAKLRADILPAERAVWTAGQDGTSVLALHLPDETRVVYQITAERVVRWVGESDEQAWTANRLEFAAISVSGRTGRVLQLMLDELPPPQNHLLPSRRFATTFVLPAGGGQP